MEQQIISPQKKPKGSILENLNSKTAITCTKVPEGLFDPKAAEKHFSKFGRVQKIRLLPKKQVCVVEYNQVGAAERAVLNAGAYDGFMFDVTRTKSRVRTRSKRDDDPDWLPDEDVEEELSAMGGLPVYRLSRQKPMELDTTTKPVKEVKRPIKRITNTPIKTRTKPIMTQPMSGRDSPVAVVTVPTSLNTTEAAEQLHQLRSKVSITPDEQWRTLDARDKILRSWGGAGSRVKVGGATIGTCPDMCPEKERLHRQAEHQVMTLETVVDSDGKLEPAWAIKQYSRSSADQEIPMCYELRPPRVLLYTAEHLRQIADTQRQVTLADWFHFMWDRFRSIRKDITQQALCCADSIRLVEMCARFHAHCGARLADLEHTQFDQKLNTDNLTKCLQTLKHMYADVGAALKPNEAEFRGYVALLNLGDANFWWEIKQLPQEIQKSRSIIFALKVFVALDNNNYVKFFRLVRDEATYLQACILLRYFNDVRARALARIVKAYAPRGGYLYPAENIMKNLAFENIESMKSFIHHYGLRFAKSTEELSIVLNRTQFIEDSDPFPISRAINLIESKRNTSVGDVICGGKLPPFDSAKHKLYSSFNSNGKLKETALVAEDLGYNTRNDTNKDIQLLKAELMKLAKGNINSRVVEKAIEPTKTVVAKTLFDSSPRKIPNVFVDPRKEKKDIQQFSFHPAIPVASNEEFKSTNENIFGMEKRNSFTFSKPQEMDKNIISGNLFANSLSASKTIADSQVVDSKNIFSNSNKFISNDIKDSQNLFKTSSAAKSIFIQAADNKSDTTNPGNKNLFASANTQLPSTKTEIFGTKTIFSKGDSGGLFTKSQGTTESKTNIFMKAQGEHSKNPTTIFGAFKDPKQNTKNFNGDGETTAISPGSLFKSVIQAPQFPSTTKYNIFQSKNRAPTVADNISSSVNIPNNNIYDFDQKSNESSDRPFIDQQKEEEARILQEKAKKAEMERMLEIQRKLEEDKRKQEEQKRKQEEQRKLEELKRLEEKRMQERKQEELKKKLEEERLAKEKQKAEEMRKAEEKRKAEEEAKRFIEQVERESNDLVTELQSDIVEETVRVILNEEIELINKLFLYAEEVTNEISSELVNEICISELKAEIFRSRKVMAKWFKVWRKHFLRNYKRRSLLEDTPVWLADNTPLQEADCLRRPKERDSLRYMNAVHKGYKFVGELNEILPPARFNLVDIIRSPFLKRMKDIQYPYDKCFFWKLTIISPGSSKWIYRRINIEEWVTNAFSDQKEYNISKSLLYVGKESWNNLMDFAISISMISKEESSCGSEAFEGTNGILSYLTDSKDIESLEGAINYKHLYQVIPVAVIVTERIPIQRLEDILLIYKNKNMISDFKLFRLESSNLVESINMSTKRALKWIAKKYPRPPSLEIDYLKSICQRYLGNEIWCSLKYETRNFKNLYKLISYYNSAVDKLTEVITDEDLFNYASFPLEFKKYLNDMSPYPKPYEFISSNVRNSDNVCAIKNIMKRLKLPIVSFAPLTGLNVQESIQRYCQQIGWFENPDEVACKVIALLPDEVSNVRMPYEEFSENYQNYDLIDILNVIVYEKIKALHNFGNRFAIYLKPVLEEYRNLNWLQMDVFSIENEDFTYEDDVDFYIDSKRRKIAIDSMEYLMLEDKDCTIVEENLEKVENNIKAYSGCEDTVLQLEQQLNEEKKKSEALENLLRAALSDV